MLKNCYATIKFLRVQGKGRGGLNDATFCGVRIQSGGLVVCVVKCYNKELSNRFSNTAPACYHVIDQSLLLLKVSKHLQEISGFAKQQGRHRNQHFHSRWACFVSLVQGIKIIVLEHQWIPRFKWNSHYCPLSKFNVVSMHAWMYGECMHRTSFTRSVGSVVCLGSCAIVSCFVVL